MWLTVLILVTSVPYGVMCMIGTLEVNDRVFFINANSMVGNISFSLAKEYKRLCNDEIRINGVKSYIKSKNRE